MNMDLEDWMVMEAIRLSLAEQEEKDRQEALKKSKQEAEQASPNQVVEGPSSSSN
jgi:ribosome recycling factor